MQMVNELNFNELMEVWRNTYVGMITAGQLVLSEPAEDIFNLTVVNGLITTSKEVTLSPFKIQTVTGVSKVTDHIKWVHVIAEPKEQGFSNEVVATSTYGDLKPGSSRVKIYLQNLTSQKVTIPAQCVISQIQAANEVPGIYAPVTSKGHAVSRATILKDENWLNYGPTFNSGVDLSWSQVDAKPKAQPRSDHTGKSWHIRVQILGLWGPSGSCRLVSKVCRCVLETWLGPGRDLSGIVWG